MAKALGLRTTGRTARYHRRKGPAARRSSICP